MGRRKYFIVILCLSFLFISSMNIEGNPNQNDNYHKVYGFTIEIAGVGSGTDPDSAWETCSGGGINIEIADASTGRDNGGLKTPGIKYYDNVTLVGPMTAGRRAVLDWINEAVSGVSEKHDVTLEIKDKFGNTAGTINFNDALPVSFEPPAVGAGDNRPLEWKLRFKPTSLDGSLSIGNSDGIIQDVSDIEALTDDVFSFRIEGLELDLETCSPGGVEFILEESVGGDEPWENKPGKGNNWVGGDEPWENKPGRGKGSEWMVGGDEPWENKPGNGRGQNWVGGDEPWENKPGRGKGSEWMVGGDEPWENKPGNGYGSDWVGGDEPWENKPGNGKGSDWVGGDEPWENKPGWGGGSDWVGGDEPWENKFDYLQYEIVGVEYGTWTITREFDRTDLTLKIMFDEFASGTRTPSPRDKGSLTYYARDGTEARTINFYGYMPINYDVISVDASGGGSTLIEKMELRIYRIELE